MSGFVLSGLFRPDKLCESPGLAMNVIHQDTSMKWHPEGKRNWANRNQHGGEALDRSGLSLCGIGD